MKKIILTLALVIFTTNLYSDWVKINSFPNTHTNDICLTGSTMYASSINNGIYKSTNSGVSWQLQNNGLNNTQAVQCYQVIQTGSILYAATVDGIYKSTDFASSWVRKSDGILIGSGSTYISAQSLYELNGTLFTGVYSGIYRSTNGGENWLATNISGTHVWAKNFTIHNGVLFAARESINNPVGYKSTDSGITWSNLTGPSFFSTITFLSEPGKLFLGTIHGAWLSTNDGANWIERSAGLSPDPYNSSFVRANGVLVSSLKFGGSGMFKSTNDGVLWVDFAEGLPFLQAINEIIIFNGKILAATSSGLYERNISELTGVNQISAEIPQAYKLEQNYPNPFNPVTKIKFEVPQNVKSETSKIRIVVYDILGEPIAELVNSQLQPGSYEAVFDAANLPSGIYFYRLEAENYSDTKRMTLVK